MYTPKISEELVPVLYRLAKERRMPMTRFVDGLIRQALTFNNLKAGRPEQVDPPGGEADAAIPALCYRPEPRNAVA